jgi:glycosyltransferase involved in cell wall biosynthesis
MRILIDGTTLCDADGNVGAGIEHYTWSLVRSIFLAGAKKHEFLIYVPPSLNRIRIQELTEGCDHVRVLRSYGPRISFISRHVILPFRFALWRPDVTFFPSGQIPYFYRGNAVVTIHDLSMYDHPEWFPDKQDFSSRVVVPRSIQSATRIIAVSQATKERLVKQFPETEAKTSVVYEGVCPPTEHLDQLDSQHIRFPFDQDYIFHLGTIEPRKNLVNALQAFDIFLKGHPELAGSVRFIVAGKRGWKMKAIEAEILRVNHAWKDVEPNGVVQFLGAVTEEEKWQLMARASVLLFPSLDEGFGLPVLEAMSVGTPVITSTRGSLPEIGGDAPLYVEPDDVEQMSLSIAQCLLVPEGTKQMQIDGYRRASTFTWERAAKETIEILKEAAYQK